VPLQIQIDQSGKPGGVPGQAREDLATGTPVQLTATGGPFVQYQWTVLDKPVDVVANVRSAAALSSGTASATLLQPIDLAQTYFVQVAVDSGSGLGALETDVAQITFYAGPTLSADATKFPRRQPAVGETDQHNVPDAIDPGGQPDGWARERARWDAALAALEVQVAAMEAEMGLSVSKVLNLTANNTTARVNCFQLIGCVQLIELYAVVTGAIGPNHTADQFFVFDGTTPVAITGAASTPLSAAPVGSLLAATGPASSPLAVIPATAPHAGQPSTDLLFFQRSGLAANAFANTFVVLNYATTDAPTSGQLTVYATYRPIGGGSLVPV
jgi:hypothetical protein